MPEKIAHFSHGRPWHDDQSASSSVPSTGTCRGNGARSTRSRSRTGCARMRCLNAEAGMSSQSSRLEANFSLLQSSSRFSTSSTEAAV